MVDAESRNLKENYIGRFITSMDQQKQNHLCVNGVAIRLIKIHFFFRK